MQGQGGRHPEPEAKDLGPNRRGHALPQPEASRRSA